MRHARQIMESPVMIHPGTTIPELAKALLEHDADGVCVLDDGKLVGVVTAMDLVFREAPIHPPVLFALLDLVLSFGAKRTEEDLARIAASTAKGLMTEDVTTAAPDTPLTEVAGWMRDEHLSMVPVIDNGELVGVITRRGMVKYTLSHFQATVQG